MEYVEELRLLSDILRKSNKVNSFDSEDEEVADTVAYALLDIQESCHKIYKTHLPALKAQGISAEDVDDIMLEIGWELEHILYHIKDSRYYAYLLAHCRNCNPS